MATQRIETGIAVPPGLADVREGFSRIIHRIIHRPPPLAERIPQGEISLDEAVVFLTERKISNPDPKHRYREVSSEPLAETIPVFMASNHSFLPKMAMDK